MLRISLNPVYLSYGGKMRLYLIQHGEAKQETEDPKRSLTEKGVEEVKRVAKMARLLKIQASKIYHSGKLRADQTAKIFSEELNLPSSSAEGLNPLDDVRPWAERILREKDDIMIVGHLPFLDKLTSLLLCGNENVRLVLFRYGAIVCLEQRDEKDWAIKWIITPEMIPSAQNAE